MSGTTNQIPALLDPSNCTLVMIDYQPQMAFGARSIDGRTLINNVTGLAKTAKLFNVPTVITSIAEKSFSGPVFQQVREVFPETRIIDRTSMNSWEDKNLVDAVKKTGRNKLVLAGLWTEVCIAFPAIDARREGYEVYVVADACGGTTCEAHINAMTRMEQVGVHPITWMQFLCEMQRDWARTATYEPVMNIAKTYGGEYGIGIQYAQAMLSRH